METIRNVLSGVGMFAIIIAIIIGWFPPDPPKKKKKKKRQPVSHGELYCFECEIEMPVKEKDGRLYCTNCKLIH